MNGWTARLVEFDDKENQCIGCAMCAKRCPDMAIEVFKEEAGQLKG